ncbi:MAG: DMT family transporter [Thaumarchaeota archaeon]|nr:DMT family transporter [Nitrososphaerota archaeon]
MVNLLPALVPAVIWALSAIYYRVFQRNVDFLTLNFMRASLASLTLLLPAFYFGLGQGLGFAVVSGVITLAVGDSLFFLAIREIGASIAAPVTYTYVLFVQFTASSVGESIPFANFVSAGLILVGVLILSRTGGGTPRLRGIAIALGGSVAWTVGNELIKVAANAGGSTFGVAFVRDTSAALALASVVLLRSARGGWPRPHLKPREIVAIAIVSIGDLALGSTLYVYSISTAGIALTVILTSISPFLTQVFAKLLGKESPTNKDVFGGLLIVAALIIAVL